MLDKTKSKNMLVYRKNIWGNVLLSFGILFFVIYAIYGSYQGIMETQNKKMGLYQRSQVNETLLTLLTDAETGQRGYILTGQKSFLAPYKQATQKIPQTLNRLDGLINAGTSPTCINMGPNCPLKQRAILKRLNMLTDSKLNELQQVINVYDHQGFQSARAIILNHQGRKLMEDIRKTSAELKSRFDELKIRRDGELSGDIRQTTLVTLLGLLAICILLGLAFHYLQKEMANSNKAYQQLKREMQQRLQSEQKITELNVSLEQQNHNLHQLNLEMESFSYTVSHDLRAPLRSIAGFSQALLRQKSDLLDKEGKDYLNRITANTSKMGQLIDDILQLSRLTRSELTYTQVNLSDMALAILKDYREADADRQVTYIIRPNMVVNADKRLLEAAMQNLLSNAWKFTSAKPETVIEVGLANDESRQSPVYFVKDNGAGFDMKYVHKLFGAFQRLHAMDEFAGNGIGLATVQRIIHRHGGSIWAESVVNQGTAFYFTLS